MPKGVPKEKTEEKKEQPDELMEVLKSVSSGIEKLSTDLSSLTTRVHNIETNGADEFKQHAKPEDIEAAASTRKGVDPKISAIVDEMLGSDFGVQIGSMGEDRPGFRFTIIVPPRLSDLPKDKRPVKELDESGMPTGKYQKDSDGNTVMEEYQPEDRRSRALASSDSYDAIRKHCDLVRGHIVASFQKLNKPLPEFKVR